MSLNHTFIEIMLFVYQFNMKYQIYIILDDFFHIFYFILANYIKDSYYQKPELLDYIEYYLRMRANIQVDLTYIRNKMLSSKNTYLPNIIEK